MLARIAGFTAGWATLVLLFAVMPVIADLGETAFRLSFAHPQPISVIPAKAGIPLSIRNGEPIWIPVEVHPERSRTTGMTDGRKAAPTPLILKAKKSIFSIFYFYLL